MALDKVAGGAYTGRVTLRAPILAGLVAIALLRPAGDAASQLASKEESKAKALCDKLGDCGKDSGLKKKPADLSPEYLKKLKAASKAKLKPKPGESEDEAAVPGEPSSRGRFRRGASSGGSSEEPEPQGDAPGAIDRQGRAVIGGAVRRAESFKRDLQGSQSLLDERAPGRREPGGPGGAGPAAAAGARPAGAAELALAAQTGFAGSFGALGLRVATVEGSPAILERNGAPASPARLEALRAHIESEPTALMRRPDFFQVLPRERFEGLKRDHAGRPGLRTTAFRHIDLTPAGRDFLWSSSCSGLSGDCNPAAGKPSYRKGEDVAPEDLNRVWERVHEEGSEDDEEWELEEYSDEDRRAAAAMDAAAARLARKPFGGSATKRLLDRLGAAILGRTPAEPEDAPEAGEREAAAPEGARAGERAMAAAGPSASPAFTPARGPAGRTAPPRRGAPSREEPSRGPLRAAAMAAGAALIVFGLRRSRR